MKVKVPVTIKCITNAIVVFAATLVAFPATAVDLVSVPDASFSAPASAGGDSYLSIISPDGRYVLFNSAANNLVHRTNGEPYILTAPLKQNAFLRDRIQGTTTLISVDSTDTKSGEDDATLTGISTNGQYVLFETASRLTNARTSTNRLNTSEIYLRDLVNKTTTLVSVRMASQFDGSARYSVMTPDARYVAFASNDTNFVSGDTNNASDIFVRDLSEGVTRMASANLPGRYTSVLPAISSDGKIVAFSSLLVSANPTQDVYACDFTTTNTICVSSNAHAFLAGVPFCYSPAVSQDGKYVVYQANLAFNATTSFIFRHDIQTGADQLITSNTSPAGAGQAFDMSPDGRFVAFIAKTNSGTGVFLWDGQTATTTFVSVDTNGMVPSGMTSEGVAVDATGRFVSFQAIANGLVTNTIGSFQEHIYRRDMLNGVTELVDAGADGSATNRNLNTEFSMSADGRFIAFDSPDTDLVVPDGNNASDVFVRDLSAESTEMISIADPSLMTQTSGWGDRRSYTRVSADGHFAAFIAGGAGLVPDYTNRFRGVFVRDLVNQSNFLVTVDTNGLGRANGAATECVLSGDGHYVAFTSLANNLVANDTNHASDVFVRDLQTGKTVLVSTNGAGPGSPNGMSSSPTITLDGRYITYFSTAQNIVPLPAANVTNLFVYDRTLRTNYVLTTNATISAASTPDGRYVAFFGAVASGGTPRLYVWDSQLAQRVFTNVSLSGAVSSVAISTNGQWIAYVVTSGLSSSLQIVDRVTRTATTVSSGSFGLRPNPRFSGDGQSLVYATLASNAPPDLNTTSDVYVFDLPSKTNMLVSRGFVTGRSPTGTSELPDISADARYVTYQSDAPDIVPGGTYRLKNIFLFDRLSGSTMLLSAGIYGTGPADYESQSPRFTADGQTLAFQSWASDLTANDFNHGSDLFMLKIVNPFDSTNPPPVFTGELILNSGVPGAGGVGVSSAQLTWTATPGFGYQVQYKTNLTDDTWLPVNGSVVIENGQGYVTDLAPDPDHRFYRIVAQ